MRIRTRRGAGLLAAVAAAMGAVLVAPSAHAAAQEGNAQPSAALQRAAEECGAGEVCFWHDRDFQGPPWRWNPASGYRDLPENLHDHVYSFQANAPACFIDTNPAERRAVNPGDFARAYDTNFGSRIDAVAPGC